MPNSPWTETGSSISLVPSTTTIGSDPENVNYLSNQDKINLMAQYTAELAMKTSLDTLASTWSVSSTFYDNAVAAISTALINAGAPSNWATTWPDGTTSGPWPGIQTSLANLWAQVATQRTALQSVISNAQAAAAQTAAIATAATNAANTYAASIAAPLVVSSLPALPSTLYPTGKLALLTTTGILYQSTGSVWTAITIAGNSITAGSITAGQIAAGAIGASQIAAGAITTAALTVADWTNLCYNPEFANGINSWSSSPASISQQGANPNGGTGQSLYIPSGSGLFAVRNANLVPVQAGQVYLGQAWLFCNAAASSGGIYIRLRGLDGSGNEVIVAQSADWASSGWTLATVTATVPAGVITLNFEVVDNSLVGAVGLVQSCVFRRCADASLIVDGSITASKIAAGAITANMITTGTLNAANVAVTNLNASNITTGTLSANMVLFPDGTELSTANRVVTMFKQPSSDNIAVGTGTALIPGLSWPVTVHSGADVFNFFGALTAEQTSGATNSPVNVYFYVDGAFAGSYPCVPRFPTLNTWYVFPIAATVSGLTTGAHTIAIYANNNGYPFTVKAETRVTCQQIY